MLKISSNIVREVNTETWWKKIHIVAFVGFSIRVTIALVSEQVHQADEIFQYLEQAHRLVFGYGYIPWEYRFGIRSWILPGSLSLLLQLFRFLHIDDPNLYIPVIKIFFCFASISLIYSAYIIGRNLVSEQAGRIASILTCVWYELIYFSPKPTPEVLSTYLLMIALAIATTRLSPRNPLLFGFICTLSGLLRFQYLPAIVIVIIFGSLGCKKRDLLKIGGSILLTVMVAGYVDYLTWGSFFASYYNNYLFNAVYKVSSLFGKQRPLYLLETLTICSVGIFPIVALLSLKKTRQIWLLWLSAASIIVSHSLILHKEHRFVFAAIPIFLILAAVVISDAISQYLSRKPANKALTWLLSFFILTTSVCSSFVVFPRESIYVHTKFNKTNTSIVSYQPILKAYLRLSKEPELFAILNTFSSWWSKTGGYYYLHRDIPIYSARHLELVEKREIRSYVSHIVCRFDDKEIPGFSPIARIGELEIRKQINPPAQYQQLDIDTLNVPKEGIDNKYIPTVRARF
jgi:GPI mannosyltransferase 3